MKPSINIRAIVEQYFNYWQQQYPRDDFNEKVMSARLVKKDHYSEQLIPWALIQTTEKTEKGDKKSYQVVSLRWQNNDIKSGVLASAKILFVTESLSEAIKYFTKPF